MSPYVLQPGGVVSVSEGLYRHFGIGDRDGTVIHASKKRRKVVREPLGAFAEGKALRNEGYPGNLPPEQVVERAAQTIGTPYRLLSDNCEHLVTHAHGLKKQSPQLEKVLIAAGVLFLVFVAAKKARLI